ncbi:hypothetical protein SERLA73DRAFT_57400 [Serpula lacrymans var. lacrymans S7.3]|uniref:WDR59/RTC1-like RING zinc finger domain-containing protein n=1 Tax=Serpula lacrymans var. lacrymans (strain S7.3) TaxID=936435 RepID=F8Q1S6_SERL3|nr:hypothetical protein SERLA73DRAFT_57400 [Serpula lacrymans var. lacrymans S7.3]
MSRSSSTSQSARNHIPPSTRAKAHNFNEYANVDRDGIPSSLSLLSARRPSWTPSPFYDLPGPHGPDSLQPGLASYRDVPSFGVQPPVHPSPSPDDSGNFYQRLQIDMKDLVGDAVGNMSISPTSRDIVLAARRGLFIIDLQAPFEVPRFLPQGGTWDVADVQWNPHPSRAEYIVSTSSEKLLIWNLLLVGKTSIDYILHSHYRAITDINWHTSEPDTVVSTGIDSWLWSWDLREPRKPVLGSEVTTHEINDFVAAGTQVKWNRQDANVLASSHLNEVLIWDRRKGSLPTSRIKAHKAKIYGIDWAHERRNDIVTCSLDKTIKIWDTSDSPNETGGFEPKNTIKTRYPVWRARDLPFGHGVLSLPQRGETALEMWADSDSGTPVEVYEGHTDVVKEFVWRKGGLGEYQLITWSKDRTLRFWPVDSETMEKTGYVSGMKRTRSRFFTDADDNQSFRHPPEGTDLAPSLSAPVGHRAILAEVRAPLPPRKLNPVLQPHHGSAARARSHEKGIIPPEHSTNHVSLPIPVATATRHGGTMSRGNVGGKSARMDAFTWLANVKVGDRRESSSGPGSGADSGDVSRISSRSRPPSGRDPSTAPGRRKRSESRGRGNEEHRDGDVNQSLQDEITSVLTKLASSKIKLEKHDLTKRRTCTLGLHGPWGESSSVFIRVSFKFPKEYPQSSYPEGTPDIDVERNPLISMQSRAFMLRRLKSIREGRRPCLEACLRFLLFGNEDEEVGGGAAMGSESSSEDEAVVPRKPRDVTVSLLRSNKNLAEPRTSQGVFGPNGELVCFFRAPPRIVRNPLREISTSSAAAATHSPETVPRFFQSPALLADAVRRLGLAATDRMVDLADPKRAEDGDNILRIMTNLLTFSQQKVRRESESNSLDDIPASYSLIPMRRSTIFIKYPSDITNANRTVAAEYIFESQNLANLCETNAHIAKVNGQLHHERVFKTLQALFPSSRTRDSDGRTVSTESALLYHVAIRLYNEFSANKDIQMLAMISIVLLKTYINSWSHDDAGNHSSDVKEHVSAISKAGLDYFSLARPKEGPSAALSPGWPRLPSTSPTALPLSASNSSRGSWSSLFNPGSVRQFMSGVQEVVSTPAEAVSATAPSLQIPIPMLNNFNNNSRRAQGPDSPVRRSYSRDTSVASSSPISKSWSEAPMVNFPKMTAPFSSAGHARRPTFSQVISPKQVIPEKKRIVFNENVTEAVHNSRPLSFSPQLLDQFACHVLAYAEILFAWQLLHKRLELLKSVGSHISALLPVHTRRELGFDILHACAMCGRTGTERNAESCPSCGVHSLRPRCSICRLPVKGLSRSCPQCLHIAHLTCWRAAKLEFCATGCGCHCSGKEKKRPSPVQSPASALSLLA